QAVKLGGGFFLGDTRQLFQPKLADSDFHAHGDVRALVMSAVVGDFLGAWAQARHRCHEPDGEPRSSVGVRLRSPHRVVIEQALHARNWGSFADEIRKPHIEASGDRTETSEHALMHGAKSGEIDRRALLLATLDEPRPVRALHVGPEPDTPTEPGARIVTCYVRSTDPEPLVQ